MKAKLYLNKENLKKNVEYIKNKAKGKKIIAMVKANAYGIGDLNVVNALNSLGVVNFGVANIDEAVRIRQNGANNLVLITSVVTGEEIEKAVALDISLSVSDIDNICEINEIGKKYNKKVKIHFKIDTGMTRLGFIPTNLNENIAKIKNMEYINVEGVYTHLSCADSNEKYTLKQLNTFKEEVEYLKKYFNFKYIHMLNSDGVESYTNFDMEYNYVRVGIMLYGYTRKGVPVTKLSAPIIHINNIEEESLVSYGGTFKAKPNMKIAVIKIGYADGISRSLSNKLYFYVNGVKCKQIGNICMDMCMVDVTDVDAKVGDEVIIWDEENNLQKIANYSNKIVYEVLTSIGNRVERVVYGDSNK